MGVIIYSFNSNISPEMSYGMLECDIVTELHAYDFVIRFCNKRGVICAGPCTVIQRVFCYMSRGRGSRVMHKNLFP